MPNDIKYIYVICHSFGNVHFKFFTFLVSATNESARWHISYHSEDDEKCIK